MAPPGDSRLQELIDICLKVINILFKKVSSSNQFSLNQNNNFQIIWKEYPLNRE